MYEEDRICMNSHMYEEYEEDRINGDHLTSQK